MELQQRDDQVIAAEVVGQRRYRHHPGERMQSRWSERIFADAGRQRRGSGRAASGIVRSRWRHTQRGM